MARECRNQGGARICFRFGNQADSSDIGNPAAVTLAPGKAAALAVLLPLLACGEEAASLAFEGLADTAREPDDSYALQKIAAEERTHDRLLKRVLRALPASDGAREALRATRRFHISLGRGGTTVHLARIAAIDAAVCTILTRLLRPGSPVSNDPLVRETFLRIRRDEARHVRVSRGLVRAAGISPSLRDIAAAAREALAKTLIFGGDSFEMLEVDSGLLFRDIRRLPDGMFAP